MSTLCTLWHKIIPYRAETVHFFWVFMNSATRITKSIPVAEYHAQAQLALGSFIIILESPPKALFWFFRPRNWGPKNIQGFWGLGFRVLWLRAFGAWGFGALGV